MGMDNWYWIYSIDDKEQKKYMQKMKESYVAFIDILGFKDMVLRNVEKVVFTLRQIKGFCSFHYKSDMPKRGEMDDPLDDMPYVTMFSDSVIITASTDSWWLHDFVDLISDLQYFLLTQGVLVRGGIDVGDVYHDKNYIFGNGLVRAYLIESKVSKYPRIVVSNRAMTYASNDFDKDFERFTNDEIKWETNPDEFFDEVDYLFSHDMYDKVTKDKHGIYYLEYLISGVLKSDEDNRTTDFEAIRSIIDNGLMSEERVVREKYIWLNDYYNRVFGDNAYSCHGESDYDSEEKRLAEVFEKEPELAIAFERN